jgi:hypothetical protein
VQVNRKRVLRVMREQRLWFLPTADRASEFGKRCPEAEIKTRCFGYYVTTTDPPKTHSSPVAPRAFWPMYRL